MSQPKFLTMFVAILLFGLVRSVDAQYSQPNANLRDRLMSWQGRRLEAGRVEPVQGVAYAGHGSAGFVQHASHSVGSVGHGCAGHGCRCGGHGVVSHHCHSHGCNAGGCLLGNCLLGDCVRGFFGCDDGPPPGEPLGGSVQSYMQAHIAEGQQLRLMMFQYDFVNDPAEDLTQLNPAGRQKLARLVTVLQETGGRLGIESSRFGETVTEGRRAAVADYLTGTLGYGISADQIEVRLPDSPGLRGVEAIEVDRTLLRNTSSQGATLGNVGGSAGGLFGGGQQGIGIGR